MEKKCSYTIVSIDLSKIESPAALHNEFREKLGFPEFYGRNWDAFWDAITGLVEMPSHLFLYNYSDFSNRFKEDAGILARLMWKFNDLKISGRIEIDYTKGLKFDVKPASIECIFFETPAQYGLRGDPGLWQELKEEFKSLPVPESAGELEEMIISTIEKLIGERPVSGKWVSVPRYNEGGMSGGLVAPEFWLERGIPTLIGRFLEMKKTWKD